MSAELDDPRLPRRFWEKIAPEPMSGCWLWTAMVDRDGYGRMSSRRGQGPHLAYRFAYERLVGMVPDGLELDHVKARGCCGPPCCNPSHLEPVTHAENARRSRGRKLALSTAERARRSEHAMTLNRRRNARV